MGWQSSGSNHSWLWLIAVGVAGQSVLALQRALRLRRAAKRSARTWCDSATVQQASSLEMLCGSVGTGSYQKRLHGYAALGAAAPDEVLAVLRQLTVREQWLVNCIVQQYGGSVTSLRTALSSMPAETTVPSDVEQAANTATQLASNAVAQQMQLHRRAVQSAESSNTSAAAHSGNDTVDGTATATAAAAAAAAGGATSSRETVNVPDDATAPCSFDALSKGRRISSHENNKYGECSPSYKDTDVSIAGDVQNNLLRYPCADNNNVAQPDDGKSMSDLWLTAGDADALRAYSNGHRQSTGEEDFSHLMMDIPLPTAPLMRNSNDMTLQEPMELFGAGNDQWAPAFTTTPCGSIPIDTAM